MTLPPGIPNGRNGYNKVNQNLEILVRRTTLWVSIAVSLGSTAVVGAALYAFLTRAIVAPQSRIEGRLEELTSFNRAIIRATCDSSFYSAAELARRTPEAKQRLGIVCRNRARIDSALTVERDNPQ